MHDETRPRHASMTRHVLAPQGRDALGSQVRVRLPYTYPRGEYAESLGRATAAARTGMVRPVLRRKSRPLPEPLGLATHAMTRHDMT